jgi:hypothetical protein
LVLWNLIFMTFHSVGNVIIIFQRGSNHQPEEFSYFGIHDFDIPRFDDFDFDSSWKSWQLRD